MAESKPCPYEIIDNKGRKWCDKPKGYKCHRRLEQKELV